MHQKSRSCFAFTDASFIQVTNKNKPSETVTKKEVIT
jgi:hypothetical protein